ncbi:site-specific integrase [Actinoplanes sp. NPDC049118]|uniref:tyrosine-type recombinase/integrase n=1 Tax=Actinoplanes sp. NPDC049118 TaxID=3155769 RepID=UPI0033D667E3
MAREPTGPRRSSGRKNANGEGSIYQRQSDGRWVGQAYALTTEGTRKRKYVYGDTWEEAHSKLVELKSRTQRGIPLPDRAWKLREYLPYWLRVYVSSLRATTARGYESAVRLHLIPALGTKRIDSLQVQHVREFLDEFRNKCLCCTSKADANRPTPRQCCSVGKCCKQYPKARQIQYVHGVLRNALHQAIREELISRNVATLVRVPSPRYRIGKGLSVEQVRAILKAAEDHRLYPLYVVAATMGLRRGELLGMRWSDLDLDTGTLTIEQTVQRVGGKLILSDAKTEDSEAPLPLPEWTWLVLLEHQEAQQTERERLSAVWQEHGLVFPSGLGTPMEPRNLNRHFSATRERAGLPTVRLHDMRHTVVSMLMELGVPPHVVQAIARHADVKLTLKVYAHTNLDAMRQALGKLDGRLS